MGKEFKKEEDANFEKIFYNRKFYYKELGISIYKKLYFLFFYKNSVFIKNKF